MSKVLFMSSRPLARAENLKAVYDMYDGEKAYHRGFIGGKMPPGDWSLLVIDELPAASPGKCIMITHGIPGGKTYGMDQPRPYIRPGLIDYAITSSEETIPLVAKQMCLDESKVLPLGMPRTDKYFQKQPRIEQRKLYLYCPTFRGRNDSNFPYINYGEINSWLHDDEVMYIKPHMLTGPLKIPTMIFKHLETFDPMIPTHPYLMSCDVLITDFSSIVYDAHVLNKPVVLFAKDRDEYLRKRGMYHKYPNEYASRFTMDEHELVDLCREAYKNGPTNNDREIKRRFTNKCDGHSTERVIDLIKQVLKT